MERRPQGGDDSVANPLPYIRGLYQLIPAGRRAALLSRTGRSSERRRCLPADSVVWLVIAMALFAADSIPHVWRRLHPSRDHPEPTDSAFSQARRRGAGSHPCATYATRPPGPWPPARPSPPSTGEGG